VSWNCRHQLYILPSLVRCSLVLVCLFFSVTSVTPSRPGSSLYRIMQFVVLISLLFTLSGAALTLDSGILADGHVETAPNVDGEGPGIPTRRSINVVRMSRGMSSLPPTRRRRGHCAYPLPTILSSTFTHMTFLCCSEAPCFACCLCCLLL
jgi:hypothetical protein